MTLNDKKWYFIMTSTLNRIALLIYKTLHIYHSRMRC